MLGNSFRLLSKVLSVAFQCSRNKCRIGEFSPDLSFLYANMALELVHSLDCDQCFMTPTLFTVNREISNAWVKTILKPCIFSSLSLLHKFWKEQFLLFQNIKFILTELLELLCVCIYIYILGQWSALAWVQGSLGYITTRTRVFQISLHTHIFQDAPQRRKVLCANAHLHTACSPMKSHSQRASTALGMPATPSPEQPSFSQCTWPWKLIRITPMNVPRLHALGNITELFQMRGNNEPRKFLCV